MNRRSMLGLATVPFAPAGKAASSQSRALMTADAFGFAGVNLNGASHHPLPVQTQKAVEDYLKARRSSAFKPARDGFVQQRDAISLFGKLINAEPDELMFIPSTSYGESMVVAALGLHRGGGRVVSDI